jgi:hypothetical protein
VLDEVFRAMPPWRKWELVDNLHRFGRELHAAGVLSRDPDATPEQIRDDWVARNYGPITGPTFARGSSQVSSPNEIRPTVEYVVGVFDRLGIAYALGGSLASSVHGVSRNTLDADLSVEPFPGKESQFVSSFGPDYYVSLDAVRSAVSQRSSFNVIQTTAGFKVDVFVRKDRPFDLSMMARRRTLRPPGPDARPIAVVSPEDIVLLKLEWYRLGNEVSDRQWSDVLGVLRTQSGRLDEAYLDRWAAELGVADLLARARGEAAVGP